MHMFKMTSYLIQMHHCCHSICSVYPPSPFGNPRVAYLRPLDLSSGTSSEIFLVSSTLHPPPTLFVSTEERKVPLHHDRGTSICAASTPPSNFAYLTPRACPSLSARIAIGPGVRDQDASLSRSRFFSRKGAGTHSPRATHFNSFPSPIFKGPPEVGVGKPVPLPRSKTSHSLGFRHSPSRNASLFH